MLKDTTTKFRGGGTISIWKRKERGLGFRYKVHNPYGWMRALRNQRLAISSDIFQATK
jgi:hypothetical protein